MRRPQQPRRSSPGILPDKVRTVKRGLVADGYAPKPSSFFVEKVVRQWPMRTTPRQPAVMLAGPPPRAQGHNRGELRGIAGSS